VSSTLSSSSKDYTPHFFFFFFLLAGSIPQENSIDLPNLEELQLNLNGLTGRFDTHLPLSLSLSLSLSLTHTHTHTLSVFSLFHQFIPIGLHVGDYIYVIRVNATLSWEYVQVGDT